MKNKKLLIALLLVIPICTWAADFIVDGIAYNIRTANTVSVTEGGTYTGSITIPASVSNLSITYEVTTIGGGAFYGCASLTSISIPSSVTTIGGNAFYSCTGLTSITIPSSVTSIGGSAFSSCTGLTSITIPSSVTTIESYTFSDCTALISTSIPSSVTAIRQRAFSNCRNLTSITIPNSVTDIGEEAFWLCTNLTSITIPSSVTIIESFAFYGCGGLISVEIPSSVTDIKYAAFSGCTGLTSITIPSSVTDIGDYAFYNCTGLISIHAQSATPIDLSANIDIFEGVDKTSCKLYVSEGSKALYEAAAQWQDFSIITEEEVSNAVSSVSANELNVQVARENIILSSVQIGELVQIVGTNGKVLLNKKASDNQLSVLAPTAGIYIVKVGDKSCKIIVQ